MRLCREMELCIEDHRPHGIEGQSMDQLSRFNGISDLGEDLLSNILRQVYGIMQGH
jgi:hypothetical protein